jgi:hypothetical protein
MVNSFKQKYCYFNIQPSFRGSLDYKTYGSIVANSIFTLTPRGSAKSGETIRFADALSLGSIVISIEDVFLHKFFSKPPVIIVSNVTEMPRKIDQLYKLYQTNVNEINVLQKKSVWWWKKYKSCARNDFQYIIDRVFDYYDQKNKKNEDITKLFDNTYLQDYGKYVDRYLSKKFSKFSKIKNNVRYGTYRNIMDQYNNYNKKLKYD